MAEMEYQECPGQRVKQGSLDPPGTWDCRAYQVSLESLVQKVLPVKRVTRVLQESPVSWEVQGNQ